MGLMYAWATPDYILDSMSFEQLILYYNKGWEARKTESSLHWGVLGQALQGGDKEDKEKRSREAFRKAHPEGREEGGAWQVSE